MEEFYISPEVVIRKYTDADVQEFLDDYGDSPEFFANSVDMPVFVRYSKSTFQGLFESFEEAVANRRNPARSSGGWTAGDWISVYLAH